MILEESLVMARYGQYSRDQQQLNVLQGLESQISAIHSKRALKVNCGTHETSDKKIF